MSAFGIQPSTQIQVLHIKTCVSVLCGMILDAMSTLKLSLNCLSGLNVRLIQYNK